MDNIRQRRNDEILHAARMRRSVMAEELEMKRMLEENRQSLRLHHVRTVAKWGRRGCITSATLVVLCWISAIWIPHGVDLGLTGLVLILPTIAFGVMWWLNDDEAAHLERSGVS